LSKRPGDHGAATVLVLAVAGAVLAAGVVATAAGGLALLRHRAAVAADNAALAAAWSAPLGAPAACASAAEVARADGARLTGCMLQDAVAEVTVSASPSAWLSWVAAVRLDARAGPAETYPVESVPLDVAS
jgi:secretion/DNA translocation related TadE-like protein